VETSLTEVIFMMFVAVFCFANFVFAYLYTARTIVPPVQAIRFPKRQAILAVEMFLLIHLCRQTHRRNKGGTVKGNMAQNLATLDLWVHRDVRPMPPFSPSSHQSQDANSKEWNFFKRTFSCTLALVLFHLSEKISFV
jgi:hypothetical protein